MRRFYTPQLRRKRFDDFGDAITTYTIIDKGSSYWNTPLPPVSPTMNGRKAKAKSTSESHSFASSSPKAVSTAFPRALSQSFYSKDLNTRALLASKSIMSDMFIAASVGDAALVDFYLKVGSLNVDAADSRGWRAIHHASLHGQAKVVELLIRRGANVNCGTVSRLTPVLLAGSCLTPRHDVIRMLLKQGANPNVTSPAGTSPLMDVCGRFAGIKKTS